MTSDLIDFVRQHRALTTALVLMLVLAYFALSRTGYISYVYLLLFSLAFIWLCVTCSLSILRSYETSKAWRDRVRSGVARPARARRGRAGPDEPRLGKPRHRMARRGMAGRGVASQGTARRGKEDEDQ